MKKEIVTGDKKTQDLTICCLQETHYECQERGTTPFRIPPSYFVGVDSLILLGAGKAQNSRHSTAED